MQLEHEFVVPVPVEQAWDVLLDVERIAPCMPGATVESFDGETVQGKVKVKVGPIQVTYNGTAKFVEKDVENRTVLLDASGKEARGSGTAAAKIRASMVAEGEATRVTVATDLNITGRPAQFGRGVMVEVGNKLLGKFADCLAEEIGSDQAPSASSADEGGGTQAAEEPATGAGAGTDAAAGSPTGAAATVAGEGSGSSGAPAASAGSAPAAKPASTRPRRITPSEPIDLLDTAGMPVLKRLAPVLVGVLVLLAVWRLVARRR
jgi:carbon monoxide dehydrogenase subunit G